MATIDIFETGYFYADGGAMFGAIPKTAWSRKYPSDASNACILAMRSLLIATDNGRRILVDTGAGFKQMQTLSYYRFFGQRNISRLKGLFHPTSTHHAESQAQIAFSPGPCVNQGRA